MKRKQALAIILSAVLSFTTCTPLGMMTVSAAENDESVVIEAEQDGGQEIVSGDEADTAVGEDFSVQEAASDAGTFVVSDPLDTNVDPGQEDIGQESSDETVIEGGDEAGDTSADENEGLSSVPEIIPDGTEEGAGDENAVMPVEQDVFSDDTGVSTDAGDTAADTIDVLGDITGDTDNSAAAGDVPADITDMPGDLSDDADNSTDEGDEAADQSNNSSENAAGAFDSGEAVFDDSSITPDAEDPSAGLPAAAEPENGTEEPSSIEQPGETESVSESAQKGLSTPTPEDLENAVDIYAGDVADVSIPEENGHVFFRVNIEETGVYALYSSDNDNDPYAGLYDAEGNELSTADDSDDSNFRIEQSFEAGTVYYLQACACGSGTGNYKVHFEKYDSYFIVNSVGDEERRVAYGDEVTLEISVESSSPVSFQWYSPDSYPIEGAQSETYTFTAERAGEYYCLVKNEAGEEHYVYFNIQIENHLQISSEYESSDVYVSFGDSATLNPVVTADDTTGLTYTWYHRAGTSYSMEKMEEVTSDSYTIDSVSGQDEYEVIVSDRYGNTAYLIYNIYVQNNLEVSAENGDTQTTYLYVSPGTSLELKPVVTADDMSSLTYVWNHRVFNEEYNYYDWEEMEGVTSDSYTIDSVSGYDEYQVIVSDQYGNRGSLYFYIYVQNNLKVSAENGDTDETTLYVSPGTTLELKPVVTADDVSGLTYTWYHNVYEEEYDGYNWEEMEGVTSDSYTIDSVSGKDEYEVRVSDQYGNSDSLYYYIYVQNNLKVNAENGDTSETTLYVSPGTSLELKPVVTADDASGLTYTWYHRVYDEENDDYNWEEMEGATSDSYTIDSVSGYDEYQVVVSDQYGNRDSLYFFINVQNNLQVSAENGDTSETTLYVSPGTSLELKPVVTADDMSGLTYEWYRRVHNEEYNYYDSEKIEGATSNSYSIDSVSTKDAFEFKVSDQYGNSDTFYYYIIVQNNLKVNAENGDTFDTSLYVLPGVSVELKPVVTADDTSSLTYAWYHCNYDDEVQESFNEEKIEGATTDSYTIDSVSGNGDYKVIVSDQYGNSGCLYYQIYVQNNLKVSAENGDTYETTLYVSPGTPLELKPVVTADDASGLTYTWYHYAYVEEYEGYNWEKMEGVTSDSYTTDSIVGFNGYRIEVSDQYGNSDSLRYYIYVQNNLEISAENGDTYETTLYVSPGTPLELKPVVTADDVSSLTYAWYHYVYEEEYDGYNWEKMEGVTSDSYTIDSVSAKDVYEVRVSDQYGNSDSLYYYIYVQNNLQVSAENGDTYDTSLYVSPGASLELKPVVTADDTRSLTYTWYHRVYNEEYEYYSSEKIEGATSDSYTIDSVSTKDAYEVIVSDQYGNSDSLYYYIYVQNNLDVSSEDGYKSVKSLYVSPGTSLELKPVVTADDTSSLTYAWYHCDYNDEVQESFNEEKIEGATTDSYTIDSVSINGDYKVIVSDQYGNSDFLYYCIQVQNNLKVSAENGDTDETYLYVSPGTSFELKPVVTADDASGLTYTWYHYVYEEEYDGYNWEEMEGVTSDSYTIDSVSGKDEYKVIVSDQYGNSGSLYYYIYVQNNLEVSAENGDTDDTSLYVSPGTSLELKPVVTADDASGLSYTWYHREYDEENEYYTMEKMEGVTSDSYTIDSVSGYDEYEVRVSDRYGNSDSLYYCIHVQNNLEISAENGDTDDTSLYVSPGTSLELKPVVTADDTSSLTYTWYHRVYDEENDNYTMEKMEGETSDSYTIDSVSGYDEYEVRVSDQYGNSNSLYYYIYVENHLKVFSEDGDTDSTYLYVSPGTSETLKPVVTADDKSGLVYEWYHREYDEENDDYNWKKMEGETSDSCIIDSVSGYEAYEIRVFDQYGNNSFLSYYIYVENHLEVASENGDRYATNMYLSPYASAILKPVVTADDTSGLTYTWYHYVYEEEFDEYNWEEMEGVTSDSYTIDSVSRKDQYEVVVSDRYGNNADLYYNIYVENNLEVYPDADGRDGNTAYYYVTPGSSLELKGTVKAENDSGISCSWYKYDQQNDYDYSEIEGADSLSYTITASSEYCRYQLLVKDQFGNEARAYFHVYASENYLAAYPAERSPEYDYSYLYITPGQPAEMKVIVQSDHPDSLTRQWFRYNETDDEYILIEGADSDTYMIDAVTKAETFKYIITDGNDLSSSVYFYVIADNELSAESEGPDGDYTSNHYYVAPGGSVDLKASVSATDESNLTFQWSVEEKTEDGEEDFIDIPGANSLSYTVENVNKRSCYRFRVSDQYGNSDTLYYYIFVKTDLEVEAEGDTVYDVAKGADLQLKANVSVMPGIDLTYSWHDDTADEELTFDASSPTVYTVSNIQGYKKITFTACDPYENSESVTFLLYMTGQPAVYPEGESMGTTSYTSYYASGDSSVYVSSDRDDQQLLYSWYDEDTGELLQKGDSSSYSFTMVNKNLNFRCRVSEIDHEDNYIDLYYHLLSKVPSAEEFAAAQTLGDHDERAVSLSKDHVWDVFKFIPSETADYYFSSRSTDGDPYGVLFDESFNMISEDDDGAEDRDFYLESTLEKGKTYYIQARACSLGGTAIYTLYSRRVGEEIPVLREQILSADNLSVVYGSSAMIQVNGAYGDLSFSSSNEAAVSVDTAGKVTANGVGTSDITISAAGTTEYLPADPITIRVTVTPATITSDDVTLDSAALTYDGKAKTPSVTVTAGSTVLVPETDYTVSYSENVNAGTDTASVTVKGCGNYTGEVTKTFSIAKAKQFITGVSNTYSKTFGNSAFSLGAKAKTKLTYKSSNTGACLVDAAGKVTIKGAGTAKITITAAAGTNYNKAVKTVTVEVAKAKQSITGVSTAYNKTYGNAAFSLGAKAKTKLTYKSSNTKVAVVTSAGKVTIKGAGTAKITITAAAGTNYNKAVKTVTVKVAKAKQSITGVKTKYSKTYGNKAFLLGAKAKTKLTYKSSNTKAAVVSTAGKVTIKGAGTTKITITAAAGTNYNKAVKTVTVSVAKAAPVIKIKTASKSFTVAAVKKAAQSFSPGITVNSKGKLSYKKSSGAASITVNASTGKITVKKGTKKGTYKIKIAATAAARGNYKKGTKTFTVTVTVK
ncbi:MAG: hypothetical protein IJH81_02575 [Lachnospiraceae bacterium]|nr:hypothetical protein [Lachnospiraceae bacterium]